MGTYFFFAGKTGLIETYQGGAFISYGGMGFHLKAVKHGPFLEAIKAALIFKVS